jgi:hypothetical protein
MYIFYAIVEIISKNTLNILNLFRTFLVVDKTNQCQKIFR